MAESGGGFGTPCTTWGGKRSNLCYRFSANPRPDFSTLNATGRRCPVSIVCQPVPHSHHDFDGCRHRARYYRYRQPCDDCPSPITLHSRSHFSEHLARRHGYPGQLERSWTSRQRLSVWHILSVPDSRIDRSILPFQGDLRTDNIAHRARASSSRHWCPHPNRDFNVEWRAEEFSGGGQVNFEVVSTRYNWLRRHLWRDFRQWSS